MSVFGFSYDGGGNGGEFTPILKYDGRSGRLFRMDREQTGDGWSNTPVDITNNFKAVFDLENLETGWIDFPSGAAPIMSLVRIGEPMPPKPSPKVRGGIRAVVKLGKDCGGEKPIRELAGNSKVFLSGMEALYTAYQASKDANPGKLPVVTLKTTMPITTKGKDQTGKPVSTTNYSPVFEIVSWVNRPEDLTYQPKNAAPAGSSVPSIQGSAPSTGSTQVPPPSAAGNGPAAGQTGHAGHAAQTGNTQGAPSSAPALEDDFG